MKRYAIYKCQRCDTIFEMETECEPEEMEAEKVHKCLEGKSVKNYGIARLIGYTEQVGW